MQFTEREMKLVERLRRQERAWPRMRWFVLSAGIFGCGTYAWFMLSLLKQIHRSMESSEDHLMSQAWLFLIAMSYPRFLILLLVGIGLIFVAIKDWHGNVNRMLLLKLLDAQQTPSKGNEQGTT